MKNHEMPHQLFFHQATSTAEGTEANLRVCKHWSCERIMCVRVANVSQQRFVGEAKTAFPFNYPINIQGFPLVTPFDTHEADTC